jgi:hypothetical protein
VNFANRGCAGSNKKLPTMKSSRQAVRASGSAFTPAATRSSYTGTNLKGSPEGWYWVPQEWQGAGPERREALGRAQGQGDHAARGCDQAARRYRRPRRPHPGESHPGLCAMFNFAVERGILENSPCAGVKAPSGENRRDRVLSEDEIRAFWEGLAQASMTDPCEARSSLPVGYGTAQR